MTLGLTEYEDECLYMLVSYVCVSNKEYYLFEMQAIIIVQKKDRCLK